MNETAILVTETFESDSLGNQIAKEQRKKIFCRQRSVTGSEFFKAGESGLKAMFKLIVPLVDYNGEEIVEYNGQRYAVYRTYRGDLEEVELYLTEKVGV